MPTWDFPVELRPSSDEPVFIQIARAISDDIRRGRVKPGDPLPSSRALSESLRVHRNTILAAYDELVSQGWITTRKASGTFVAPTIPEVRPARFSSSAAARTHVPAVPHFPFNDAIERPPRREFRKGTLILASGVPDVRLLPVDDFARAVRRVMKRQGRKVLSYGDAHGYFPLREALARMVSSLRGVAAGPENVIITRGSQMALELSARLLVKPGDVIAVESMGYAPAWAAFRMAGAQLLPLPVDEHGLQVDALKSTLSSQRIRAIYVTPHHQYPTTVSLAPGRRMELLEVCRKERIAILEDDYDHEFHFDGRPVLPLASADASGSVIYIGTLSKILAPGLRLGFLVAPAPFVDGVAALRNLTDRQGDLVTEAAVAELLDEGLLQRHVRRMRRVYQSRRDVLADALHTHLKDRVEFTLPPGGLGFWLHAHTDVEAWSERAEERGAGLTPGRQFMLDGKPRPCARAGYALLNDKELVDAVRRLEAAWPTTQSRRSRGPNNP